MSGRWVIEPGESGWPSATPEMNTRRCGRSARALGAADDDRRAAVALEAAVEQPERVGDHPRIAMVLERDRLLHHRVVVEQRMLAAGHRHLAELLDGGAVQLHVAARHRRVELRRRDGADRVLELGDEVELRHRVDARAGLVGRCRDVAAEGDQHMVAGARRHRRGGALQRHHRARAAVRNQRREAQVGDAEVVDEVVGGAADDADRDHAVDLLRRQPGVARPPSATTRVAARMRSSSNRACRRSRRCPSRRPCHAATRRPPCVASWSACRGGAGRLRRPVDSAPRRGRAGARAPAGWR